MNSDAAPRRTQAAGMQSDAAGFDATDAAYSDATDADLSIATDAGFSDATDAVFSNATDAVDITGADRSGRWLISCDHATNRVPDWLAASAGPTLGLDPADMHRHIAWDIGALGFAQALGLALDGPVIASRFSRLVIDPNRGEDDPTLLMKLYDGTIIPGNRYADDADRNMRLDRLHRPYHAAYAGLAARRRDTVIVAVHSFTPQLAGRPPRPWDIAILHSPRDSRLAVPLIARLRAEPDLTVGDNAPYTGHLPGDAIDRHALGPGRANVLIELRQDLIAAPLQQQAWADRLAPILTEILEASGL